MENENEQERSIKKMDFSRSGDSNQYKGTYTNSKKQVFEVTVSGPDPDAVAEFAKDISVELEVRPGGSGQPPEPEQEDVSREKDDEASTAEEPAIIFEFECIDSAGIEPPYTVGFYIDPLISEVNRTSGQSFPFPTAQWINATVTAIEGEYAGQASWEHIPQENKNIQPRNSRRAVKRIGKCSRHFNC